MLSQEASARACVLSESPVLEKAAAVQGPRAVRLEKVHSARKSTVMEKSRLLPK